MEKQGIFIACKKKKKSFISSFKTHTPVKPPIYLQDQRWLRAWTPSALDLFFLYLICLNGDMSLPSTHAASFSSELTQSRDLSFFLSLHRLRQTMRGKNRGRGGACRFTYLFLQKRQTGRQSGMSMCGSAASDWCEITVTAAHSGATNTHTQTHTDFAGGWVSRVQP